MRTAVALALVLPALAFAQDFTVGDFHVRLAAAPFSIAVARTHELLPARAGLATFRAGRARETVKESFGRFAFDQKLEAAWTAWDLAGPPAVDARGALTFTAHLKGEGAGEAGTLAVAVAPAGDGTLTIEARAEGVDANRLWIAYPSDASEGLLGLGERYDRVRQDGKRIPIWTSEQGIGRSDHPVLPFTGATTDTYFPVPYYMSTRGHGVLVDGTARSVFDLRVAPRADRIGIEVWDRAARLVLFDGPTPRDVLRRLTARTGRPRRLPDWAFGVWLGVQGGTAHVLEHLARVKAAGAPVDAVWVQDWLGGRNSLFGYDVLYHWSADPKLYPDLGATIARLHGEGVKFLGYFNSFIEPSFPEFAECARNNWLVTGRDGKPWTAMISTFRGGLLDLSNEGARAYMAGKLRAALKLGLDGWMADFGEWLPWDAGLASPEGGRLWHNRYPIEWARLNREAGLAERPDGDFVIFARSGFAGSGRWLDLVWAGDQNTSWKTDDGLPTVIPAGLSLGLSGAPLYHFDAGGFTSLVSLPRGEELFMRWVEAAACSPVLRTHEGYWRQMNVQADSSPRVLAHFAKMAQLHARLQPAIVAAAREASESGMPILRHLWLEHPDDATALGVEDEWLLGRDVLAAPVVTKGAAARRVYFPAGRWRHWATGAVTEGPAWATVAAPLGQPPLFVRAQP